VEAAQSSSEETDEERLCDETMAEPPSGIICNVPICVATFNEK
jgi:hypothetical protein